MEPSGEVVAPTQAMTTGDQQKLDEALIFFRERLKEPIQFKDSDADAMAAPNSLLRLMITQAEAIAVLSKTEYAEAANPNLRTMFEAWSDLKLIPNGPPVQTGVSR